jgi:hypothetical protein
MTAKHAPLSALLKDAIEPESKNRMRAESGESFSPEGLYPPDHEFGMKVPEGGSACSKCGYLDKETMEDCKEEHFVRWNGGSRIKGRVSAYCCDNFEAAKSQPLNKENTRGMTLQEIVASERPVEGKQQ